MDKYHTEVHCFTNVVVVPKVLLIVSLLVDCYGVAYSRRPNGSCDSVS